MMNFSTLSTVWARLGKGSRIVIVTEPARLALAEEIGRDNLPYVSSVAVADADSPEAEVLAAGLAEQDLLVVLLTVEGFMERGYRNRYTPFSKPTGVAAKYAFIRLDIPRESLLTGLNTGMDEVLQTVDNLEPLQAGRWVRVATKAGTDLVLRISARAVMPYDAGKPGGIAFLPPSEVSEDICPDSAEGVLVADVTVGELRVNGTLVDGLGIADEPVKLRVHKGLVVEVAGGQVAERLRRGLAALPAHQHAVVELGHGLSRLAATGIIGVDESMLGTCHIGVGNRDPYHLDLVMRDPSFELLEEWQATERIREARIRDYFAAWLCQDPSALDRVFAPDAVYSECYGPEYRGIGQLLRWFSDWNRRGRVLAWHIRQFVHQGAVTAVEWSFRCEYDGVADGFDGMSLVEFDRDGRIFSLKEFQSKAQHHFPYGE